MKCLSVISICFRPPRVLQPNQKLKPRKTDYQIMDSKNCCGWVASCGLVIHQRILPNHIFGNFLQRIYFEDSDAKTSHSITNLRPHYNDNVCPALFYVLVWKPLDVCKYG